MFDNIGGKIKKLAEVLCQLGIIGSIIIAIGFFISAGKVGDGEDPFSFCLKYIIEAGATSDEAAKKVLIIDGFVWLILGPVISWASCLTLYGFGRLVEHSEVRPNNNGVSGASIEEMRADLEGMHCEFRKLSDYLMKQNSEPIAQPAPVATRAPALSRCQWCGKVNVPLVRANVETPSGCVERVVCEECYRVGMENGYVKK